METVKTIVYSNLLGLLMIAGAIVGIVGGSLAICGVSTAILLYMGG